MVMLIQCTFLASNGNSMHYFPNSPLVWLTGCMYGDRSSECLRESCSLYTVSKRRDCCYTCADNNTTPSESTTQRPNDRTATFIVSTRHKDTTTSNPGNVISESSPSATRRPNTLTTTFIASTRHKDTTTSNPGNVISESASSAPGKTLHLGFDWRQLICCVRTKAQISLRIMQSDECLCCSLYKNNITLNLLVIPRHFKKCGVLCYTLHSKNCVRVSVRSSSCPSVRLSVCMSVCMSVRPSVRPSAHRFHSLLGAFFNQFSSNLP